MLTGAERHQCCSVRPGEQAEGHHEVLKLWILPTPTPSWEGPGDGLTAWGWRALSPQYCIFQGRVSGLTCDPSILRITINGEAAVTQPAMTVRANCSPINRSDAGAEYLATLPLTDRSPPRTPGMAPGSPKFTRRIRGSALSSDPDYCPQFHKRAYERHTGHIMALVSTTT